MINVILERIHAISTEPAFWALSLVVITLAIRESIRLITLAEKRYRLDSYRLLIVSSVFVGLVLFDYLVFMFAYATVGVAGVLALCIALLAGSYEAKKGERK